MGIETALIVTAAAGAASSAYGAAAQGDAASASGRVNAQNAEFNAELAKKAALEEEKKFRQSFRRQQSSNIVSVGASGIRLEGSALEVLRDNTRQMEEDAITIRKGGDIERLGFVREARGQRRAGRAARRAGSIGSAGQLLSGAASTGDLALRLKRPGVS